MADAPPGRRCPLGQDQTGQWGHSSDQAAGQLDDQFFFHYRTLLSNFFMFFLSLISLDWCRWAQLDGAERPGNTHREVEL